MYGRRQLIILMQNLRTAKPHFMYHFLATTTILPKSFFLGKYLIKNYRFFLNRKHTSDYALMEQKKFT